MEYEELEKAIKEQKLSTEIIEPFSSFVEAIDEVAHKLKMEDTQVSKVLDFLSESVYRSKRKAQP